MTQTEALARLRMIVDESSAGKWADTELYDCLDAGQNKVIQLGLTKELMGRADKYKSPVLIPLITLDPLNTTTISAGYDEYALPSDYLATNVATYSVSTGGTQYPCIIKDFSEAVIAELNTFEVDFKKPFVYSRAEKLGFIPQPSGAGANNYTHYYYKQPAVVASGQDFTLREETHESIIEYGAYYALTKDNDQRAAQHLNNFILSIQGLV